MAIAIAFEALYDPAISVKDLAVVELTIKKETLV